MSEFIPEETWEFPEAVDGGLVVVRGFDGVYDEWRAMTTEDGGIAKSLVSGIPLHQGFQKEQLVTTYIDVCGLREPDPRPLELLGAQLGRIKNGEADPSELEVPIRVAGFIAIVLCCVDTLPEFEDKRARLEVPTIHLLPGGYENANRTQQEEFKRGLDYCGFQVVHHDPFPITVYASRADLHQKLKINQPSMLQYSKRI